MKKLLIVLTTNPLNRYYYEKYELRRLNNHSNIKIKYWNLLSIQNKKIVKFLSRKGTRTIYDKNFIVVKDILSLIKEFRKLPKSFFYLNEATKRYKISIIDRILKICGGKKIYLRENSGYQYITYKQRYKLIKKNFNSDVIKKFIKFPWVIINNFIKFKIILAKPSLYFVPNRIWYKNISKNTDSSKIKKIQDYDYQIFRKFNKTAPKKKFIVFIDQEMDYSFDHRINYSTKPFIDKEDYWGRLDKFLALINKKFNLRPVVAASHRRNIYDRPIKYKFFFDKTVQLIKNSKFVIAHDSTALYLAILFKKPIILLTHNDFKKKQTKHYSITTFSKQLGVKMFNLSNLSLLKKDFNFNSYLKVNNNKYEKFIKKQFTFKNKNSSSNWDNIKNELEKVT